MNPDTRFIACGMYAFTDELRQAWQALFDRFYRLIDQPARLDPKLVFDSGEQVLRDPRLFIGHTCGYPLMTRLNEAITPFCVPVFDLPGTEGRYYSSVFVVGAEAKIETLAECRNRVVAINSADSNSGMNVLRHAVAQLEPGPRFFSSVLPTRAHLHSLEAVADGRADVAAIDCVSFQLIADKWPQLGARVRAIGYSAKTCGLPFVIPRSQLAEIDTDAFIDALEQALAQSPPEVGERLHLDRFEAVDLGDYQAILELESFAIENGYAELK